MSIRPLAITVAGLILVAGGGAVALPMFRAPSASAPAAPAPATPRTFEAIPMFPGLVSTGEQPIEFGGLMDWNDPYPLIEGRKRSYATTATAEEVFAFYKQRLGGKVEHDESDSHSNIGPGGATPVILMRHAYEFQPTENILTNRAISADTQRAMLANNRPASAEGDWISEGSFEWVIKDRSGAPTEFHLKVIDESVAENWTGYAPRTVVEILVSRYGVIQDD